MRYFFMQFWDHTIDEYPEIRRSLFVSTHDLANVYLGPNHPITLISHLLPRMENKSSVCEVAWRRQLDTFESILSVANDESLRLKMSLTGNYVVAGQYDEAETLLWQIVSIFRSRFNSLLPPRSPLPHRLDPEPAPAVSRCRDRLY